MNAAAELAAALGGEHREGNEWHAFAHRMTIIALRLVSPKKAENFYSCAAPVVPIFRSCKNCDAAGYGTTIMMRSRQNPL